ncbi:MAG: peptidylprolyl isomerase [Clostridia bacterium]|nr:peptidylprolyl isomerase [Clostridia bacterium]
MYSENKTRQSIIVLCCCVVCVIAAAVCMAVSLSGKKNSNEEAENEKIVAGIGDLKITESQFEFFAKLILNQEEETVRTLYTSTGISDKDELKKYTSNFVHEYLVRVAEAKSKGIKLSSEEIANLEKQFKEDYENNKEIDSKILSPEEFYVYYYGISEKLFKEFWENWYIIDKHTSLLEKDADLSEDAQLLAFEEYYDYLYSYTISVIELEAGNENSKEDLKEKAENIVDALEQGEDFVKLLKENCKNETLIASNGVKEFYPTYKTESSEIYDFVRTSEKGEIGIVETDYAIYVLRLDDIKDYEKLKNTETLLKWTRTFYVNKTVADMVSSDKYKYKVEKTVYDAIDLSSALQEAYAYWETIWEGSK